MNEPSKQGSIVVCGLGPGGYADMTHRVTEALCQADIIIGYRGYTDLVRHWYPDAPIVESELGAEYERCLHALNSAQQGHTVALVSSGDAGIYAMAGLLYEVAWEAGWRFTDGHWPSISVLPGVTAATAAAARIGAPLMSDYATVSLSDLLLPWPLIERRLRAAAQGDFVLAIYNPMSRRRREHLPRACAILLEERSAATPVAIVRQVSRPGETVEITTLEELTTTLVDMLTVIIVGNSSTRVLDGRLVTARGYPLHLPATGSGELPREWKSTP
ncbi:MAG: precorrin-3B C(17)-methyltransferase [Chloroflexi bacterium]|nr:precorrin-3B C(17)-methyltransferase [Chloroflexota bacterium]